MKAKVRLVWPDVEKEIDMDDVESITHDPYAIIISTAGGITYAVDWIEIIKEQNQT